MHRKIRIGNEQRHHHIDAPIFPSQWKHRANLQNQVAFTSVSPEFTSRFHVTFKQNLRQASNSIIKTNPSVIPSFIIIVIIRYLIFLYLYNSKKSSIFSWKVLWRSSPQSVVHFLDSPRRWSRCLALRPTRRPLQDLGGTRVFSVGKSYRGNSLKLFPLPKNNASKKRGYVSTKT